MLLSHFHSSFHFSPSRLVFADKKDGGSKDGKEVAKEQAEKPKIMVTSQNLREVLLDLAKEGKIKDSDVSKALEIAKTGTSGEKEKLIKLAQQGVDGNMSDIDFQKLLREAGGKIKDENEEENVADDVKKKIFQQTGEMASTSEKVLDSMKTNKKNQNQPLVEKMQGLHNDFRRLNMEDLKFRKPIKEKLDAMVEQKQLTEEQAEKIYNIDLNWDDGKEMFEEILKTIKDPKVKKLMEEIQTMKKNEAENDKKIKREYEQKAKEFRELSNQLADQVYEKAAQEKALEVLQRSVGLPLQPNQRLIYKGLKMGDDQIMRETKEEATVKEVIFEDIEIKDDQGKVIKKIPSNSPTVILETKDPDTKEIKQEKLSGTNLHTWVNQQDVTEDLETHADLDKTLGQNIKEGDVLEYRLLLDAAAGVYSNEDKKVTIKKIDEAKKQIELDEPVVLIPGTHVKDKILSFGQFAKWFKRNESLPAIDSIKILRDKLRAHNQVLNEANKRNPAHYPPIEVKKDEVLKFDNHLDQTFVIKDVTDKKITLDNGDTFSPAAFLRWVKKNGVERKDPASEAEEITQHITDENEKAEKKELTQAEIEDKDAKRILQGQTANDNSNFQLTPSEESQPPSASYMRKLWDDTTFLSLDDFWKMGTTIYEFGKRKMERWQKGRVGKVGETMFMKLGGWIGGNTVGKLFQEVGGDFKGEFEHAEHEEVSHHAEHMKTWGVKAIQHELHNAPNKDILRASIQVLTEKGELRWDDPGLIASINRLSNGLPRWVREGVGSIDDIEIVLDDWWGESTTKEYRSKQDSAYNNIKSGWKDHAGRLESDPDGLKGALQRILAAHMSGEYVCAAQYEEYLHYAIEAGKMTLEDKLFFLIMGIGAVPGGSGHGHGHGHGMTLLHLDRVGAIESALLNNFPLIDFFTAEDHILYDEHGKMIPEMKDDKVTPKTDEQGNLIPKKGKPNLNNYTMWINEYVTKYSSLESMKDPKNCDWNAKHFSDFLWDHVAWNGAAKTRLTKASSNTSRWDHDDYHILAPMLTEQSIEQVLAKQSGATMQSSFIALENSMAGFNEFTKVKIERLQSHVESKDTARAEKDIYDIVSVLRTFIRFDAILDTRFHHTQGYSRLGDHELNEKPLVDSSRSTRQHRDEVRAFIEGITERFGLEEVWNTQVLKKLGASPDGKEAQIQENIVSDFGRILENKMRLETPENLSKMFMEIQGKNFHKKTKFGTLAVAGICNKPQKRQAAGLTENKDATKLQEYIPDDIKNQVDQIRRAKEKLKDMQVKTTEEIKTSQDARINEIIREVDGKNYLPQENDKSLLTTVLSKLQRKIDENEQGIQPPATTQSQNPADGNNGVPQQRMAA